MRLTAALAIMSLPVAAQLTGGRWRTDLSKHSIDLKELKAGGPGKDGIPALSHPRFVTTAEARKWLDHKPVIVVEAGGEVRAYPLEILIWHELVNDSIGDLPIL